MRYFEEGPDGTRREVLQDNDEETLKETLASFRNLENQSGISPETLMEALEGSTNLLDPPGYLDYAGDVLNVGSKALAELDLQNKQLQVQIQLLKDKSASSDISPQTLLSLFKPIATSGTTSLPPNLASTDVASLSLPQEEPVFNNVALASVKRKRYASCEGALPSTTPLILHQKFPSGYRHKIKHMLESLVAASLPSRGRKPGKNNTRQYSVVARLWRDYLLCRPALMSLPQEVPQHFWTKLWNVFASSARNLDRMVHLKTLGDDMLKVGIDLVPSERFLHIESTFIHGNQVEAIRDWKALGRFRWNDTSLIREYHELGVRMFCITNQIDKALESAESIFRSSHDPTSYRILIPIITACLSKDDRRDIGRAWALYEQLRLGLGKVIGMEDYDTVTSLFLEANQPDLALRIFTDMMLTGNTSKIAIHTLNTTNQDSAVEIRELISHDAEYPRLKWKDSRALAKLPSEFNNRHFFGSWTKKLIGAGELDSVKKVFDLMQERGIRPSPIHMNGLIGAWLRNGTEKSQIMAEELAWKMIQARVDFVRERDRLPAHNSLFRAIYTSDKPDNKPVLHTPLATMETFTILIQQYRRRQKSELFGELFDALEQTRIPIDTKFMNELLWIDTKGHHKGWVWQTYQSLMNSKAAAPDFTTYAILWQNMKKQEDPVIGKKVTTPSQNYPDVRNLFADMVVRTKKLKEKEVMPRELYDLIVQCLSYSQNLTATAVALRALQKHFNMVPNVQTARTIVLQLARLGLVVPHGGDRRILGYSTAQERIAEVTKVMGLLKQRRIETIKDQGAIYQDLGENGKEEESLTLLLELLQYAHDSRKAFSEPNFQKAVTGVAKMMLVPDCGQWETMPYVFVQTL